jgi:ubiquinone/menaquinone biosynthesis C-methylase UbiE
MPGESATDAAFLPWVAALEARHLANMRVSELARALRALSSAYVERRHVVGGGRALDSAGKRAAFALFYAPLHFLEVAHVVRSLGLDTPAPRAIVDLGCGTGAAGAAWALAAGGRAPVIGIDRHPWAVEEARWTLRQLGVGGRVKQGHLDRLPPFRDGDAIVAAYTLNELDAASRQRVEAELLRAADRGGRVLVVEPIARAIAPWWDGAASQVQARGGRADEWRVPVDLPAILRRLDQATGLDHRELRLRTLALGLTAVTPPPEDP